MIITCPACNTRYVVSPTAISPEGRTVKCARCAHSWHQSGEEVSRDDSVMEAPPSFADFDASLSNSLPVPQKKGGTPGWLIAACAILLLGVIAGGVIVFEQPLRAIGFVDSMYEAAGLPDSTGAELRKLQVQVVPGRRYTRYFVTGEIHNMLEEKPVTVAGMRVSLMAADGSVVRYTDYTQDMLVLEPGDSVPFSLEEKSRASNVAKVVVDLGNSLEIGQR